MGITENETSAAIARGLPHRIGGLSSIGIAVVDLVVGLIEHEEQTFGQMKMAELENGLTLLTGGTGGDELLRELLVELLGRHHDRKKLREEAAAELAGSAIPPKHSRWEEAADAALAKTDTAPEKPRLVSLPIPQSDMDDCREED